MTTQKKPSQKLNENAISFRLTREQLKTLDALREKTGLTRGGMIKQFAIALLNEKGAK